MEENNHSEGKNVNSDRQYQHGFRRVTLEEYLNGVRPRVLRNSQMSGLTSERIGVFQHFDANESMVGYSASNSRQNANNRRQNANNPRQNASNPRQNASNPRQNASNLTQNVNSDRQYQNGFRGVTLEEYLNGVHPRVLRSSQMGGLTSERIGMFQHFDSDESMVGEQCIVCMNDLEIGTKMVRLDCHDDHYLCKVCADRWFEDHKTCPNCRHAFD